MKYFEWIYEEEENVSEMKRKFDSIALFIYRTNEIRINIISLNDIYNEQ